MPKAHLRGTRELNVSCRLSPSAGLTSGPIVFSVARGEVYWLLLSSACGLGLCAQEGVNGNTSQGIAAPTSAYLDSLIHEDNNNYSPTLLWSPVRVSTADP